MNLDKKKLFEFLWMILSIMSGREGRLIHFIHLTTTGNEGTND